MTLEENKLTVTEIVELIHYYPLYKPKPEILEVGKVIHKVLGYDGEKTYERYIKIKFKNKKTGEVREEIWKIIGKPDRIENNKIVEFKTLELLGLYEENLKRLVEATKTQANLYCWLTGLSEYIIKVFVFKTEEIRTFEFKFDKQKALNDIVMGIKLKEYLSKLEYKYWLYRDKLLKKK